MAVCKKWGEIIHPKNRVEKIIQCFSDSKRDLGQGRFRKGYRINYSRSKTLEDFSSEEIVRLIQLSKKVSVGQLADLVEWLNKYLSPDETMEFFQLVKGKSINDLMDFIEQNRQIAEQSTADDFREASALIHVKEVLNS